jgi:hypothetical protein
MFLQLLLQWKSNKYYIFLVCLCIHRYPACNTHAPCCHPVLQYFPTLSHKRHDLQKKKMLLNINSFLFSICNIFWPYFNEIWIFSEKFKKILNCRISWKSFQWEPSCSIRTDKHDGANSRFSQFCERPKNTALYLLILILVGSISLCYLI